MTRPITFADLAVPPTDLRPLRGKQAGRLPFAPRTYDGGHATVALPDAVRPLAWPWLAVLGLLVLFGLALVGR
jgi:hypothetical protein